jgi:16S rRNA (uracil1498-N3)-methyltransferase
MQSGRGLVPPVEDCIPYEKALLRMAASSCPILLYEGERELCLSDLDLKGGCALLVGPEGGISPNEAKEAASFGIPSLTLGPRILRTETAGPAAIAIVTFLIGV